MSTHSSASHWLRAAQLNYTLPDGGELFSGLALTLHLQPVGLVGRNGVGKSVLARLLAGELMPASGRIERQGHIAHVAQRTHPNDGSVADLLGYAPQLAALQRIAAGSCQPADFDCVAEDWDLEERLQRWLSRFALDYLEPHHRAQRLSGGELARLDLIAALLHHPDHLILDEPSNHLDRPARHRLAEFIAEWRGGLLLISHDRTLLEQMRVIYSLDEQGLHRYGGNYSAYLVAQEQERHSLEQAITQGKAALQREQREQRALQERQQRRLRRGRHERRQANQSKLLLDRQKERSDHGSARLAEEQSARVQRCATELRRQQQRLTVHETPRLTMPDKPHASPRLVVQTTALCFGFERPLFDGFELQVMAGERIALHGANGSGKSTLLRLLTGALLPHAGSVQLRTSYALIDQHTRLLDVNRTPLENFRTHAPGLSESDYHHHLARLGLDALRAQTPVKNLSGGERVKTTLACVLLGAQPVPLLLLDEPSNHLDLEAIAAVESVLRDYRGSLLVISHDDHFLEAIGITREVMLG